jgi:hypothetical protein
MHALRRSLIIGITLLGSASVYAAPVQFPFSAPLPVGGAGFSCTNQTTPSACAGNDPTIWNDGDTFQQIFTNTGLPLANAIFLDLSVTTSFAAGQAGDLFVELFNPTTGVHVVLIVVERTGDGTSHNTILTDAFGCNTGCAVNGSGPSGTDYGVEMQLITGSPGIPGDGLTLHIANGVSTITLALVPEPSTIFTSGIAFMFILVTRWRVRASRTVRPGTRHGATTARRGQ